MAIGGVFQSNQIFQHIASDQPNLALVAGARNGTLNRNEFLYLNQEANRLAFMRGRMAADGLSPEEQLCLLHEQARFDRLYQLFRHGDYYPSVNQDPHSAHGNQIYNGLVSGQLTGNEGLALMREQRGLLATAGHFSRGGIDPYEWAVLRNRYQVASHNIFNLRHNWIAEAPAY